MDLNCILTFMFPKKSSKQIQTYGIVAEAGEATCAILVDSIVCPPPNFPKPNSMPPRLECVQESCHSVGDLSLPSEPSPRDWRWQSEDWEKDQQFLQVTL